MEAAQVEGALNSLEWPSAALLLDGPWRDVSPWLLGPLSFSL